MKKNNNLPQEEPKGKLYEVPLEEVLPSSMLPYAEFVILDRALPRVEDGLKPVQRRILYTMNEMGLLPDKPHKKSARIVGDCMGKYHPHGDSSVYDAMVRMAQNFNMGMTLVDGHGNFGSVDGDPAAAMRYTEARLAPLALELLRDLDKETVTFSLNFDDSLKEPDMLPGRFPNLLVNGASGIAVGLATNIPPHNLGETIDAVVAYIDKPNISLEEMMKKYLPAPDFPTGGYIIANELEQAYRTGKGKITLRGKVFVEEGEGGKKNIVITELPYQVNKAQLLRRIADLKEEKKEEFAPVVNVLDESDRTGMRAVIVVRGDTDIPAFMAALYRHTNLETSFGINMVAIANGKPMLLGLMEIISIYVEYQREIVLRRTKYELNVAKERCHILEGLIVAVRNIDEVIQIIKKAESVADARGKLQKRFDLTERQAQAILDLRLARLTKLEVFKLEEELAELRERIKKLSAIVASKRLQLEVVKEEILEIKKKYNTPRRSVLVQTAEEADAERTDIRLPGVASKLLVTANGNIKCVTDKMFDAGDKTIGERSKKDDIFVYTLSLMSDEDVLFFTDAGNAYRCRAQDFNCKFAEKGFSLSEVNGEAKKSERVVAVFRLPLPKGNALFLTEKGMIKLTAWSEYNLEKAVFQAIKLGEGDRVLSVQPDGTDEECRIVFVTEQGMCLKAKKDNIPLQGRISGGVKGINLEEGDKVVYTSQIDEDGEIIVVTSEARYKRVICSQIGSLARYRKGVTIAALKEGVKVIFAESVTMPYFLAAETTEKKLVEFSTEELPIDEGNTRGRVVRKFNWTPVQVFAMKYREDE